MIKQTDRAYTTAIYIYKSRRATLKSRIMEKHGWDGKNRNNGSSPTPAEYTLLVKSINTKIRNWGIGKRALKRKQNRVNRIADLVIEFTGEILKKRSNSNRSTKKQLIARSIFAKYVIERGGRGITGRHVSTYIDYKGNFPVYLVSRYRTAFNKSFKKKPENKELYHRFLEFVKNNE